jgi:hypothetical protein
MLTVPPGSPVPVKTGVGSVMTVPLMGPVTTGGAGGMVSTVTTTTVGSLSWPAPSPATTWISASPSGIGVVGVQVQLPLGSATAVQSTVPVGSSVTVISAPGSAVPLMVGVGQLIAVPADRAGDGRRGDAAGSTVMVSGVGSLRCSLVGDGDAVGLFAFVQSGRVSAYTTTSVGVDGGGADDVA